MNKKVISIIKEVINNDFPEIRIEAVLGYEVNEKQNTVLGQIASSNSILYSFVFSKSEPRVTLQRYF